MDKMTLLNALDEIIFIFSAADAIPSPRLCAWSDTTKYALKVAGIPPSGVFSTIQLYSLRRWPRESVRR